MGHYCWVCERVKANEKFSGKGHKHHICKQCAERPLEERQRTQALRNIHDFLFQSNISDKNITYLKRWSRSKDEKVCGYAKLVLAVACVKPHKRNRFKFLARNHPQLLTNLRNAGLLR